MKLEFPWKKIQLINATKELVELKLWEQFDNMDFFVVETPLEDPVVVSLMGAGAEEYGICAFRGPDAFKQPLLLTENEKAVAEKGNTIGFSMEHYRDMHRQTKNWYRKCNYRTKKNDWLPEFIVLHPGQYVEMPEKDHDVRLLLYIIKAILTAHEKGCFNPKTIGRSDGNFLPFRPPAKPKNRRLRSLKSRSPDRTHCLSCVIKMKFLIGSTSPTCPNCLCWMKPGWWQRRIFRREMTRTMSALWPSPKRTADASWIRV